MAETEKLIESICDNPELYNSASNEYRSNEKRAAAWNRVSASLGLSEHECRRRWKSVRDRYIRERRLSKLTREEGGRSLGYWCHRESLCFLNPYIREKQDHRDTEDADDESDTNEENLVVVLNKTPLELKEETQQEESQQEESQQEESQQESSQQEESHAAETAVDVKLVKLKPATASQVMPDIITPQMKSLPLGFIPLLSPEKQASQMTQCAIVASVTPGPKALGTPPTAHQVVPPKNDISLSPLQLSPLAMDTDATHRVKTESKGTDRKMEKRVLPRPYDEDELFLLSFVPVFKRLTPQKRGAAKIKIHQIMYDAEFNDE